MKITATKEPLSASEIKVLIRTYVIDYVAKRLADIDQKLAESNESDPPLKDRSWDAILLLIKKAFKYDSPSLRSPRLPQLARYIEKSLEISLGMNPPVTIMEASATCCDLLSEDKGIYISFLIKSLKHSYCINVYLLKQLDLNLGEDTIACTSEMSLAHDSCVSHIDSERVNAPAISSCRSCFNHSICKYVDNETGPIDVAYAHIKEDFDFLDATINCKYYRSKMGG